MTSSSKTYQKMKINKHAKKKKKIKMCLKYKEVKKACNTSLNVFLNKTLK